MGMSTGRSRIRAALGAGLCWAALGAATRGDDLARLIPARGLTAYVESDGLDAHRPAWEATAACQFLGEAGAGRVIADAARRAFDDLRRVHPAVPFGGAEVLALQDQWARHGFAFASIREGDTSFHVTIAPRYAGPDVEAGVRTLLTLVLSDAGGPTWTSVAARGRSIRVTRPARAGGGMFAGLLPHPRAAWWLEGTTLVVVRVPDGEIDAASDPRVARVLDAIEGKAPNAATLPLVEAARAEGRDLAGFEPTGLAAFAATGDAGGVVAQLGAAGPTAEGALAVGLGVGGARRVVVRWGFRGPALLTACRFGDFNAGGPGGGLLAPAGFPRDRLPPIPARSGAFLVAAPARPAPEVWAALAGAATVKDEYRTAVAAAVQALDDAANRRAFGALAAHLGPAWSLHAAPDGATAGGTTGVLLAGVADRAAAGPALDALAARLDAFFREQEPGDASPALALERLPAPEVGYRLASPAGRAPWLTAAFRPTVLLGRGALAVAANPDLARAALAGERDPADAWAPAGAVARAWECLPARPSFLIVGNPRDSIWPGAVAAPPGAASRALARLVGDDPDAVAPAPGGGLLAGLGVAPAARPVVGPDGKPRDADALRALIFPSVVAGGADDRGFRIVALEALPLGCLGLRTTPPPPGRPGNINIEAALAPTR